jgi:hypothetical protein
MVGGSNAFGFRGPGWGGELTNVCSSLEFEPASIELVAAVPARLVQRVATSIPDRRWVIDDPLLDGLSMKPDERAFDGEPGEQEIHELEVHLDCGDNPPGSGTEVIVARTEGAPFPDELEAELEVTVDCPAALRFDPGATATTGSDSPTSCCDCCASGSPPGRCGPTDHGRGTDDGREGKEAR